jgi:hypothetical protein
MDGFLSALGEENLIGLSSDNPTDQKNNCVFVTLAYLMGYRSTAELDIEIRKDMARLPADGSGGVPLSSISALTKKTGQQFVYKSFQASPTGAGTQAAALPSKTPPAIGTNVAGIRGEEMLLGEWNVTQIGIIYIRPASRGGHCIVVKQTPADGLKYVCYQSESGGKDLWADAAGKKVAGGPPTVADPTKGTKVLAAFAIVDHAYIPSRIDPPTYELGNPPPSGAAMLGNTASTIAAPAASALAKAFV